MQFLFIANDYGIGVTESSRRFYKKTTGLDVINKKPNPFDEVATSDYAFRNSASGNSVVTPKQRSPQKMKIILKSIFAILILTGVGTVMFTLGAKNLPAKEKIKTTKMLIRALNNSIDDYKADTGIYPSEEHGLTHLKERHNIENWNGPYWEKSRILPDGWNNSFDYKLIRNIPVVISSGADGVFGTYDDIETTIR